MSKNIGEIKSSTLDDQNKTIEAIIGIFDKNDIKVKKKVSRYQSSYKALEVAVSTDLKQFFKTYKFTVEIQDVSSEIQKIISGKYTPVIVRIKSSPIETLDGKEFYCVNTYTEKGSIKTKELSPSSLGLSAKFTSVDMYDRTVESSVLGLKIDDPTKKFMLSLFNQAKEGKVGSISYDSKTTAAYSLVKPQDRQSIGKDFGEVISLRWVVNQPEYQNFKYFYFQDNSNAPLIDYIVVMVFNDKEVKMNFSAKFEAGAAPSLKAILDYIPKVYPSPTQKEKKFVDSLLKLTKTSGTTSDNILESTKKIKHPGYVELERIIGKKNLSLVDISNYLEKNIQKKFSTSAQRIQIFKKQFASFYEVINKKATDDSLTTVFKTNTYKGAYSLVISPLGYSLVDYMNDNPMYTEILNNIAKSIPVQQVYLDFNANSMKFKIKKFSDAEFSFSYGANAKNSNNTGIKFKMQLKNERTQGLEKK
jgi:hypothetical protein